MRGHVADDLREVLFLCHAGHPRQGAEDGGGKAGSDTGGIHAAFRTGEVDGADAGDAVGVDGGHSAEYVGVGDELEHVIDRTGWC